MHYWKLGKNIDAVEKIYKVEGHDTKMDCRNPKPIRKMHHKWQSSLKVGTG